MGVLSFLVLLTLNVHAFANPLGRCTPFTDGDEPLKREARILHSRAELDQHSAKVFFEEPRLQGRAYSDGSRLIIPYGKENVRLPAEFLGGLRHHIEAALERTFADHVVYEDLGHLHLALPEGEWSAIKALSLSSAQKIERLLQSPHLKALYHTVEMVQLKDGDFATGKLSPDPWKRWRYVTRNLLGGFGPSPSVRVELSALNAIYNTVRNLPGFTEVTTLYFSGNRRGCLPYRQDGEERFFDLTFESIPYRN